VLNILNRLRRLMPGALPRRCFISHAYADQEHLNDLLSALPGYVCPLIFPPIHVTPDQRVSDDLVKAILGCDGLIYVRSALSIARFWVIFERDYALRSRKLVYAYGSDDHRLTRDRSSPIKLRVFPSCTGGDMVRVKGILETMKKRCFSVWSGEVLQLDKNMLEQTERGLRDIVENGGYLMIFISRETFNSIWVRQELEFVAARYPRQALFVALEDVGPTLFDSSSSALHQSSLFQPDGRLDENRVDDLIIRIYYMVHKAGL
jgi:hypothetical protein